MKKTISILTFCFLSTLFYAQNNELNLDFETIEENKPSNWSHFGSDKYKIAIDSDISNSGKNSATIEYQGSAANFKAWSFNIPAHFGGKKIKLTGYIKTENVQDGWAGLWMRIDPEVAFDNMKNRGVTGTTEWTKYEVELNLSNQAKTIVVGGLLVGTGKMWLDNLNVTVDGKPLHKAPIKELSLAEKDTEFDSGSNIIIPELNETLITNLDLLGRIWGFLKYYHPEIGKGNYNWDYELFRVLPEYAEAKTNNQRDQVLLNWIAKLGPIKDCKSCKEDDPNAFLKPDLAWINHHQINTNLKDKLNFIKQNRHQGAHHYISMQRGVKNPKFNEDPYLKIGVYPDAGFRLLTLFKYWNIIQYYFPYKHLTDKDWNSVLAEYIPKFISAKNELEFEKAAIEIIGDVKDTHANLWGGNNAIQQQRGEFYPPVHVRFIENQLVVTDYYNPEMKNEIGLEIGDVITKIKDVPIQNIIKEKQVYYPASNKPTQLRDIARDLLRSNNECLTINYKRHKEEQKLKLNLFEKSKLNLYSWYPKYKGKSFKTLEGNIGYITLQNIKQEDIKPIKELFKNTKGIIIDIRNYPSTFVPFSLGTFFTSKLSPFVKFTHGNINNPGEFSFKKDLSIPSKGKTYKGKLIVLVNELSQSQAEYTAMAFRAGDNTTIIGSTTAAADGNVSRISLPGGLKTMISGIGVYYPDGTETQRIGIIPDIEIKPTIIGTKEGRDEVLEKAIEIIKRE